jgi:hypothetical protein
MKRYWPRSHGMFVGDFLPLPCCLQALIIATEQEGLCPSVHNRMNVRDTEPGCRVSPLIGEFSGCGLVGWEFLHTLRLVQVRITDSGEVV